MNNVYDIKTKKRINQPTAIDRLLEAASALKTSENPRSPFYKRPNNQWDFPVCKKDQELWD